MSASNSMMIASTELDNQIDHTLPLEEKLLDAMKKMQSHWLVIDETNQLECAVNVIFAKASDSEKELISNYNNTMNTLAAMLSGVSINEEDASKQAAKANVNLKQLWEKAKEATT